MLFSQETIEDIFIPVEYKNESVKEYKDSHDYIASERDSDLSILRMFQFKNTLLWYRIASYNMFIKFPLIVNTLWQKILIGFFVYIYRALHILNDNSMTNKFVNSFFSLFTLLTVLLTQK